MLIYSGFIYNVTAIDRNSVQRCLDHHNSCPITNPQAGKINDNGLKLSKLSVVVLVILMCHVFFIAKSQLNLSPKSRILQNSKEKYVTKDLPLKDTKKRYSEGKKCI